MEIRQSCSASEFRHMDTNGMRKNFLVETLFQPGTLMMVYSHFDRIIAGSAVPQATPLSLDAADSLRAEFFLQRRELGLINLGGPGTVEADGASYPVQKYECLYLGRGTRSVTMSSDNAAQPAQFYFNSCPAHASYPAVLMTLAKATPVQLGSDSECNRRTIYKYIHPQGIASCQLVMGVTILEDGSVWNTMPAHTHERRMEVYLYFDLPENQQVFHLMGPPEETRHLVIRDRQAVISPSWSIHSGVGTRNYSFVWGMCGENQDFGDMDAVASGRMR